VFGPAPGPAVDPGVSARELARRHAVHWRTERSQPPGRRPGSVWPRAAGPAGAGTGGLGAVRAARV